jgi:hypothetical protein
LKTRLRTSLGHYRPYEHCETVLKENAIQGNQNILKSHILLYGSKKGSDKEKLK